MSPEQFLKGILDYVKEHDKKAYNYFTPEQLKSHIVHAILHNQICIAFGACPAGPVIGGVATWEFRHGEREIHLVGLVGSAAFARSLVRRWKRVYPFYRLAFWRRERRREHQSITNPILN